MSRGRWQARGRGGRYARNTMENTFGLHVEICLNPECRGFIAYPVGEMKPEVCPRCGTPVGTCPVAEADVERQAALLIDGEDGGRT